MIQTERNPASQAEPVRPSTRLVPRDPEWELFKAQVDRQREIGQVSGSIINFTGTAGIGKTTLLRRLLREDLKEECPSVLTAIVDFDLRRKEGEEYATDKGPAKVLEDLVVQLSGETALPSPAFEQSLAAFYSLVDEWSRKKGKARKALAQRISEKRDEVGGAFVKYVEEVLQDPARRPVVLFFDTVEHASRELLAWLEEKVLLPLTDTGRVICVAASRQEVDWQRWDILKRVNFYRLRPFDEDEVAAQMPLKYSYLAPKVIQLSFGLPAATAVLADQVWEIEQKEEHRPDEALLEKYKDHLVVDRLLHGLLYQDIMAHVSPDLREALTILSPLRHFTPNVIASLLPEFLPDQYAHTRSGTQALIVIRQMGVTTLVDWDREKRGYAMEDPLRRIMALALMLEKPGDFFAVHQRAADLYKRWIHLEQQENRSGYIIEWLYHRAYVLQEEGEEEPGSKLKPELAGYLKDFYVVDGEPDVSAIDVLRNQLQGDNELKETIGESFPALLEAFEPYISTPEV